MKRAPATMFPATLTLLLAPAVHATAVPAPDIAEVQLRAINHRVINAFALPDRGFMDKLAATDFLLTDVSGNWLGRHRHPARLHAPWLRGDVSYDEVEVRLFGPIALVHGVFESFREGNAARRVRYTDVYHWGGSRWRLVNAQHTVLRDGVARRIHQGRARTRRAMTWRFCASSTRATYALFAKRMSHGMTPISRPTSSS